MCKVRDGFATVVGALLALLNCFCCLKTLFNMVAEKWRGFGKWTLRQFTRLCQLQRIMYGELPGYRRTFFIEQSLRKSKVEAIREAIFALEKKVNLGVFNSRARRRSEVTNYSFRIANAKGINQKLHIGFAPHLAECLELIFSYQDLCVKIFALRNTRYDSDNPAHEAKLLEIWKNFMAPEELTARKSRQWQNLGFQGNDPATDFRASGELGLNFIVYFTSTYQERSKQVLGLSNHPIYSFPLAILMIQIIDTCFQIFIDDQAKTHFYNRHNMVLSMDDGRQDKVSRPEGLVNFFYDFGCVLLVEFSQFYISKKPRDIMSFPPIYKEFVEDITERLKDDKAVFLMDIQDI